MSCDLLMPDAREAGPMRVLIVITKGELGGAQTHVLELCRMLHGECEFRVMMGATGDTPLGRALSAIGVPVDTVAGMSNESSLAAFAASVRQVAQAARSWQPDLIHVHSAMGAVVGRMAGLLAGRRVLYTVHGFGFKREVPLKRRVAVYAAERLLAVLTTKYICVSEAERQLARKLGVREHAVSVIGNGVSDTPWRADADADDPVLVMVARAVSPKRHDLLLRALATLRERGIAPPRTLFAGSGPLLDDARMLAGELGLERVSFLGDVRDVPQLLAQSHIFVLLSDHEGQPISIIEAMRAGLPVVASDLPGIRTQVSHGVEGLLATNDPEAIASALAQLLQDPQLRRRMAAAARRRYEREFSSTPMAQAVKQVYCSLAAHQP